LSATVTFPSGAALRVAAGPAGEDDEHYEPHGTGNPLLDTSGAVRSTPLSPSFTVGELARSGAATFERARIDPQLVRCLQKLRNHVGRPVHVTSGYRPHRYNARVYARLGLRPTLSRHSSGQAADVKIPGMTGVEIAKAAIDACGTRLGLGIGPDHAHIDVRGRLTVWTHLPKGPAADAARQAVIAHARSPVVHEWLLPPATRRPAGGSAGPGKWVVLVAGYDYERGGVDFEAIALNRMRLLIRRHQAAQRRAHASLSRLIETAPRFVLFDVKTGLVRQSVAAKPKGTRAWSEVARFQPVTSANYSGGGLRFDTDHAGRLSITDVYEQVQTLGTTDPRSLGELSFLSHGYVGGPILVNSWDNSASETDRDPNDKDARALKDFVGPTIDDKKRAAFQAAFASDGHAWMWGCAFYNGSRQVLHRVLSSGKYRTTRLGGVADDDVFEFRFARDDAVRFLRFFRDDRDHEFFPAVGTEAEFPVTFRRTFEEVKTYLSRHLDTYCQRLAVAAQVPCFGALTGTYADYEKEVALPVMVVPTRKPPYSDDFTRYVQFYTTYLGVTLDPEGRHYGRYEP
jgi:hypothetical protein